MTAAVKTAAANKPVVEWDDSGDDSVCIVGNYRGLVDGGCQPEEAWVWKIDLRVHSNGNESDWKELIHHSTAAHYPNSMRGCKLALEWFLGRLNASTDTELLVRVFQSEALPLIGRQDRPGIKKTVKKQSAAAQIVKPSSQIITSYYKKSKKV